MSNTSPHRNISIFTIKLICIVLFTLNLGSAKTGNELIFQPVIDKLLDQGIDSSFIYRIVNDKNVEFQEKFVKINVVGKYSPPDYSSHYSESAVIRTKEFLEENEAVLSMAEEKYGVPKNYIASILYVETRHGNYLGYNNMVSVFLSTALANEERYKEMNSLSLKETYSDNSSELNRFLKKLDKRSEYKSNWAFEQLIALEKLDAISPLPITEIEGSWAGAFGISQFLPSSYLEWAVDGNNDGQINLFDLEDAIFSVANYLKENGWGNTRKKKRRAIWHYNHSTAYVDAVVKLATLIKS